MSAFPLKADIGFSNYLVYITLAKHHFMDELLIATDIQEKAGAISLALRLGFADVSEAISWADFIIEYSDETDDEIVSVSLSKSAEDAISHLNNIAVSSDKWNVLRLFLGRFKNVQSMSPSSAFKLAQHLKRCVYDHDTPKDMLCFYGHYDDLYLVVSETVAWDGTVRNSNITIKNFLDDIRAVANT